MQNVNLKIKPQKKGTNHFVSTLFIINLIGQQLARPLRQPLGPFDSPSGSPLTPAAAVYRPTCIQFFWTPACSRK